MYINQNVISTNDLNKLLPPHPSKKIPLPLYFGKQIIVQWNPRYNEVLGTMKITLLYQVSHYIRVKKVSKKYKELGPAKLPCYKRVLLYLTSL